MDRKRRRQSDGIVHHYNPVSSPLLDVTNRNVALATLTPTLERKAKSNAEETAYLQDSGSFQIVLLKEALSAKGDITRDMNRRLNEWEEEAERYGASLNSAQSEINTLKEDHSSSIAQVELLSAEKEALELQRQDIVDELNDKSVEKDTAINKALATIESMLMEKEQLEGKIESLEDQNEKQDATMSQMKTDFDAVKEQCDVLQDKCAVNDAIIEKNDSDITKLLVNLVEAKESNVASMQTNEALQGQTRDLTFTVNNLNSDIINGEAVAHTIQEQKELAKSLANQMSDKEDSALSENQCLIKQGLPINVRLNNTAFNSLFSVFKNMAGVSCKSVKDKIRSGALPVLPFSKVEPTKSVCLAWHTRAECNTNCSCVYDHVTTYTDADLQPLHLWCTEHFHE